MPEKTSEAHCPLGEGRDTDLCHGNLFPSDSAKFTTIRWSKKILCLRIWKIKEAARSEVKQFCGQNWF